MHVGIDLGASFSRISCLDGNNSPFLIPDHANGDEFHTPSQILSTQDGVIVGAAIENMLEDNLPLPSACNFKTSLGSSLPVYIDFLGREWKSELFAAFLMKKLIRDAKTHRDKVIGSVSLSVPVHSSDTQRRSLLKAAQLAGLNVIDFICEPLAAAAYYHYSMKDRGTDGSSLVYALGASNFQAAIVKGTSNGVQLLAAHGLDNLGGNEFDRLGGDFLRELYQVLHSTATLTTDSATADSIRRYTAALNHHFSTFGNRVFRATVLLGNRVLECILTPASQTQIVYSVLRKTLDVCDTLLESAGATWRDLQCVYLVGGATSMPFVRNVLLRHAAIGNDRIVSDRAREAVVFGLVQPTERSFDSTEGVAPVLTQTAIADLGFRVLDARTHQHKVQVVIPRGTILPVQKSIRHYTNRDRQDRMFFDVVQQREKSAPVSVGRFSFLLQNAPKNHGVDVSMGYDRFGLVTVSARDSRSDTELTREFEIETSEVSSADQTEIFRNTKLL